MPKLEVDPVKRRLATAVDACAQIVFIIERVENRCMAVDGPVTPTTQEITESELRAIWLAARKGMS